MKCLDVTLGDLLRSGAPLSHAHKEVAQDRLVRPTEKPSPQIRLVRKQRLNR